MELLWQQLQNNIEAQQEMSAAILPNAVPPDVTVSPFFAPPLWQRFYALECELNDKLRNMQPPANITHTYNPLEYAAEVHCAYLQRYLSGTKELLFVGMNPGPNGMGQTGVPFGNVKTVKDLMQLQGRVDQPPLVHPKRPVRGLDCTIEEPSGVRLWTLFQRLAGGSLDAFSQRCYVHNFCPLAFFDCAGKNITPSELKGDYKMEIRDACLRLLDQLIALLQPEIVVAVGEYVHTALKKSKYIDTIKVLRLPHPSPRSLNNQNWPEKAEAFLLEHNLLRFFNNSP